MGNILSEVDGSSGCGFSYASSSVAFFLPQTIPVSLQMDSETAGSAELQPRQPQTRPKTILFLFRFIFLVLFIPPR